VSNAQLIRPVALGGKSMSTAAMMGRITEASPHFKARIAGVLWLACIATSIFGGVVGFRLTVANKAKTKQERYPVPGCLSPWALVWPRSVESTTTPPEDARRYTRQPQNTGNPSLKRPGDASVIRPIIAAVLILFLLVRLAESTVRYSHRLLIASQHPAATR